MGRLFVAPERNERLRFRIHIYLGIGVFLLIVILSFATVLRTSLFSFRDIQIAGTTRVASSTIIAIISDRVAHDSLWRYVGEKSFLPWVFSDTQLLGSLSPLLLTAEIQWLEHILVLHVTEPTRYMIWCFEDHCSWIDNEARVLEDAPLVEGQIIPTIYDDGPLIVASGAVLSYPQMAALRDVFSFLSRSAIPILSAKLSRATLEITALSALGPTLFFSLRFPFGNTLPTIDALRQSLDLRRVAYLDFRTQNKIFYQLK